jgi:hypothetical protein
VLLLAAAVGLLLSLYGPALPELQASFGVGGGASGLVLSAHFAGAIAGIAWWGLERRLPARTWLRLATALLVAGALGIVFAPVWPVVLLEGASTLELSLSNSEVGAPWTRARWPNEGMPATGQPGGRMLLRFAGAEGALEVCCSAWAMAQAALIRPMWLKAWG